MTRIGLLSDTHGLLDKRVLEHSRDVDEIWHAGDIGSAGESSNRPAPSLVTWIAAMYAIH